MLSLYFAVFTVLIFLELIKGLSANGTPPVLQKLSWQIDLAYFMWSNIRLIRIIFVVLLAMIAINILPNHRIAIIIGTIILGSVWGGIYWLFNHFWVGRKKFKPLSRKEFAKNNGQNNVEKSVQVLGVDVNGVQKAYPVAMIYYHHQVPDVIGNQAIWVTYCGLCNSGRVFDRTLDGKALDFTLVGAVTFNAVFRDQQTGSWWRQELGEAAKGPLAGKILEDIPMEQMSLENWLKQYPDSEILQYDPAFQQQYDFRNKLMSYEASLPGWHRQETPSLIIGLEIDDHERAYDWGELQKKRLVEDTLGNKPLMVISSEDGTSSFAFSRSVNGQELNFTIDGDKLVDTQTHSTWTIFGQCIEGSYKGTTLEKVQNYKQFIRAWLSFHPASTFYDFTK